MVGLKKRFWISLFVLLIVIASIFFILRIDEDSWIRDSRGLWIEHGNPVVVVPQKVTEQQEALSCASELYVLENMKKVNLSSQCLGTCGDYSVDLVNVPRTSDDNLAENQCKDFINKKTHNFIELNSRGNLVRIVD